jgi:hypothetical protein
MAEKIMSNEELDQVGLTCIEIDWDNQQKLTTLFHHYVEQKEPLPASGVNDNGDTIPNLSFLARFAKIKQGKQVFRRKYARDMLDEAIDKCGIEDLSKSDEKDETQIVRAHLQSSIDSARRDSSGIDKKLKSALDKVNALTDENQRQADENQRQAEEIIELKAQLSVSKSRAGNAEKRIVTGYQQERKSLKRVFGCD